MKAQISELWETGINIISVAGGYEDEDGNVYSDDEITSFADLRKCENVLVGKKEKGAPCTEVLIDEVLVYVSFRNVSHPTGFGKVRICEIA